MISKAVDLSGDLQKLLYDNDDSTLYKARLNKFFPFDDDERSLGNLLGVVAHHYSYCYPKCHDVDRLHGQFFEKRALRFGGVGEIQPYITPDFETVSAILTLYLIESGVNVVVGRTLDSTIHGPPTTPANLVQSVTNLPLEASRYLPTLMSAAMRLRE